ncbi:MAG: DUF5317 domain-containing protein [Candidatus Bipolaricaulota bacterium]|jgi:hypothetical protein|nr:DUF5317 domain-containing protein [Candidatus Bipolaricaulota bacterium]
MFLIVAVILGVIIGYLSGGRLSRLALLKLKFLWLVLVALLIQFLIFPLFTDRPILPYGTAPLHLLSYALVFLFLAMNFRILPLLAVGIGALLNLLVICVNGGYMPSSATALSRSGAADVARLLIEKGTYGNVKLMGKGTTLDALGDLLYLPKGLPLATVFSVGDLVMAFGLAWLVFWGMRRRA